MSDTSDPHSLNKRSSDSGRYCQAEDGTTSPAETFNTRGGAGARPGNLSTGILEPESTVTMNFKRTVLTRAIGCIVLGVLGVSIAHSFGAPLWTEPHVDLEVYLRGGHHVLDALDDLYAPDPSRLPFTYPPFAATVFALLAKLTSEWATATLTILSVGALAIFVALWARLVFPNGVTYPRFAATETDAPATVTAPDALTAPATTAPAPKLTTIEAAYPNSTPPVSNQNEHFSNHFRGHVSWPVVASLAFCASLPLQPTIRTLDLGQVNLLLTALIVAGLTLTLRSPDRTRDQSASPTSPAHAPALASPQATTATHSLAPIQKLQPLRPWIGGALLGIATGFKLTPAVFVAWLLLTKRWKALGGAVVATLATMLLGALALPKSSWEYWTDTIFNASRIGELSYAGNQSLNGIIWRSLGPDPASAYWIVGLVATFTFCTWLAFRSYREGRLDQSILSVALFGLLVSPVSWDHHWVWQSAILISLAAIILTHDNYKVRTFSCLLGAAWLVSSYTKMIWWNPHEHDREYSVSVFGKVLTNAYPLLALATLALLAWITLLRKPASTNA